MNQPSASPAGAPEVAYLFPGQGAQRVGMGISLWERSPAARVFFQQVDEVLETPLTRIMFQGPQEKLDKTVNAQPAILAVSLACFQVLEEALGPRTVPPATVLAGHSLGEYTALALAGVLAPPDALRLVQERGRLMQQASERHLSGMAAVMGLDELAVEEVCRETGTVIATINAEDQIVIAGAWIALARALDLAALRGARKAVRLPVSGAFHSPLMQPAAVGLSAALEQVTIRDPKIPVIANCTGRPLTTAVEVKEELVRQLYQCVQWRRSVSYLLDGGVKAFYEIGPGRVLTRLLKRMHAAATLVSLDDHAVAQALAPG